MHKWPGDHEVAHGSDQIVRDRMARKVVNALGWLKVVKAIWFAGACKTGNGNRQDGLRTRVEGLACPEKRAGADGQVGCPAAAFGGAARLLSFTL